MVKSPSGERNLQSQSGNTHNLQRNYDAKMTGKDGAVVWANASKF